MRAKTPIHRVPPDTLQNSHRNGDNWSMTKQLFALGIMLLTLSACEGESASTSTVATEKDLFSVWTLQGDSSVILDFKNVTFGTQTYALYLSTGGACVCQMGISGSQSAGTIILASCVYNDLGSGGADPGCAGLNSSNTYSKTSDTLTLCDSSTCDTYK